MENETLIFIIIEILRCSYFKLIDVLRYNTTFINVVLQTGDSRVCY